jgi:hypothetical protein
VLRDYLAHTRESALGAGRSRGSVAPEFHAHMAQPRVRVPLGPAPPPGGRVADGLGMVQQRHLAALMAVPAPPPERLQRMSHFTLPESECESARLRRPAACAVRLSFSGGAARTLQRAHLLHLFGLLPGVSAVSAVLFAPDMRAAFVAFLYTRRGRAPTADATGAGAGAASSVGVECDGVAAVRALVADLGADLPTPYLAAHRASGDSDEAAAASLRALLRPLLAHARVTECSQVQMDALRRQWSGGSGSGDDHSAAHQRADAAAAAGPSFSHPQPPQSQSQSQGLMQRDTGHMFSARGAGDGVSWGAATSRRAAAPPADSSSRGSATARAASSGGGGGRTNQLSKARGPRLDWPDGLFAHVQAQQLSPSTGTDTDASASARPLSPSVFVSQGRFSSVADGAAASFSSSVVPPPSDMERRLRAQADRLDADRAAALESRRRAARAAPVRGMHGPRRHHDDRDATRAAHAHAPAVARHLNWTLTAQIEAAARA